MEKSKVYFTDFRTRLGEGLPSKLKRLMKAAGIQDMDMDHKFVAIKMHFGELGNLSFLRANYAKVVADFIKERGGKVTREAGPMKHGTTVIAFVEDPDGYKIELIQRAEGAAGGGLR